MTTPTAVEYNTEKLIAGPIRTQQSKLAAGTYYRGQLLEYDAANDRYKALNTGDLRAIWLEEERTLTINQVGSLIVSGEVFERGLVDGSDDAYTVTEDLISAWQPLGFYVKR